MSSHRCTGGVATCAQCSARRDAFEDGPLASDVAAAADRGTAQLEARVYGEGFRDWHGDHSTAPVIDPADEADLIRQLQADARRILGGAA